MNDDSAPRSGARSFGLEVIVIVGSILLAFSIDASWDNFRERSDVRAYLTDLQTEFDTNRSSLDAVILGTSRQQEATRSLAEALRRNDEVEVPDSILVLATNDITYNPATGAYQSFVSSGRVSLIEAQDLQRALASWPAILEDAVEEQRRSQQLGDTQIKPALERSAPDLADVYEKLAAWEISLGMAEVPAGSTRISSSESFANLLERRVYFLKIIRAELEKSRDHLDRLLQLIAVELS